MDKRNLEEYIDACEVIKETEAEIHKLEEKMRQYLAVIRNSLIIHSTSKYREQRTHMKMTERSEPRKKS